MFRGLRTTPAPWGELIASAQAVMGLFQDDLSGDVERLYEEQAALPLIAAARILDAASLSPAGLPPEHRRDLALTAAVAFGMYGNSLSAAAAIRRSVLPAETPGPSLAAVVATAAPSLVGEMIPCCPGESVERRYLEGLAAYLRTGNENQAEALREGLIACVLAAPSPFEGALLRSCRLCLEHILRLSIARVFRESLPHLPGALLRRLVDRGVHVLLPPQFKAIVRRHLATRPENAILALPTSAGKTLLGELCLAASLGQRPGVVCYLAPYIALGRQIGDRLQKHLPNEYRVHTMVGGYRVAERLDPETRKEVVVATPERLDGLLRTAPEIVPHLRCIVVDEAHLIQNDTRGVNLEGVITRLLLLRGQGRRFRLVLLSAVLSRYDRLQEWIDAPDDLVVTDSWRPTARRLAFWRQSGRLVWCLGTDPVRGPGASNGSVIGEMDLPWPESRFYRAENIGYARKKAPQVYRNVAYLAELFRQRYEAPILCFCPTKEGTRMAALALAQRFPVLESVPGKVGEAIELIESSHRFLLPLAGYLRRGVAYHNSTLPADVRRLIEEALQDGQVRAVSSTTTLAEGVDFPFRFTILIDWLTWQGDRQRPMSTLLFRNIAGRCGRAGLLTEGDTVVFDNPLGDPALTYAPNRAQIQDDIFLAEQADEVTSALDRVSPGTDDQAALHGVLASQFLAAIPENPDSEGLAARFGEAMFWSRWESNEARVRNALGGIERSLLDDARGALAMAASPMRLILQRYFS